MDDAITLRPSKQIVESGRGYSTILQSPQIDRQPHGDISLERAFKHALHIERKAMAHRRPDDRYCVGCGDWRPLSKFDTIHATDHLALCRSCAATTLQPTPVGHKQCARCFNVKPHEAFGVDSRMRGGYESRCKSCEAERKRVWRSNSKQVA